MVFFYISAPLLFGSRQATIKELHEVVLQKNLANGKEMPFDRKKFKMANLDTLMFSNDKVLKLETNIEGFLKKLDKQYSDLTGEPNHEWFVRASDRETPVRRYFSEFKWSDSKYPMSYPIPKIVELFENKIHTVENELRLKTVAYNDTKVQLTQAAQKEGNYNVKDLSDVIVSPYASERDFIYTKFVTTVVCIVPSVMTDEFKRKYELLTDNVIPFSARKLKVPEKDHLTIWTVGIFNQKLDEDRPEHPEDQDPKNIKKDKKYNTPTAEFIDKAREQLKIVVKEFKYETGLNDQRKKKREGLESRLQAQTKQVADICLTYFSEIYQLYIHAKMLRLVIESNMRFGSDETIVYCIEPAPGKEKQVQTFMIRVFGDRESENDGLYGTKEQIDDGQDFFPFIYVPGITL